MLSHFQFQLETFNDFDVSTLHTIKHCTVTVKHNFHFICFNLITRGATMIIIIVGGVVEAREGLGRNVKIM